MHLELSTAFVLGLLSILSPCTLVVIPMVTSHAAAKTRGIFLFLVGFITAFGILGLLAVYTGKLLTNVLGPWLYLIAGALTLFVGLHFLRILPWHIPLFSFQKPSNSFLFGLLFGGIGLSCIGPQIAAVLSLIFARATLTGGFSLMAMYAIGFSLPFAVLGTGLATKKMQKFLLKHASLFQRIGGMLMVAVALYLFWIVVG